MMTVDLIITLFLTLFPLTVSPGPANILLASSGTSFGLRRTVPFMVGTYLIFAMQSLILGIGLGEIIFRNPSIVTFFQVAGAVYLLYLATQFFQASAIERKQNPQRLDFKEGIILGILNFKSFVVQALMFALFLDPSKPQWTQILFLTVYLTGLGVASGLIWVLGGDLLGRFLQTEKGARWQGRIFGATLVLVAGWMIFSNLGS
jgi:threonine/homoserine/homoserine lactone efflux protein